MQERPLQIFRLFILVFLLLAFPQLASLLFVSVYPLVTGQEVIDISTITTVENISFAEKLSLQILTGLSHIAGFIVMPLILLKVSQTSSIASILPKKMLSNQNIGFIVLIVLAIMPFMSMVIEWNQQWDIPSELLKQEDLVKKLTQFMTDFESLGHFLFGVLIIAIIPAIGEELVFRGIIQNEVRKVSGNPHVAIWVTAILFSAIHFQFLGFLPRMLLGALFGYLYYWSGNMLVPVIAHFTNNFFTLLMYYLYNTGNIEFDVESPESAPLSGVIASFVLSAGLLYYYKRFQQNNTDGS